MRQYKPVINVSIYCISVNSKHFFIFFDELSCLIQFHHVGDRTFNSTFKNLDLSLSLYQQFFCCLLLNKFVESLAQKHSSNSDMSKISYQQYEHQYRKIGEIGKGSFGKVLKVLHESTQHQYALKLQTFSKQEQIDEAIQQIQILKKFRHPLIVQLHAYYRVTCRNKNYFFSKHRQLVEIGMLLQLGQYSLDKIIKEDKNYLSQQDLFNFTIEFIQLFAWLEDQNIVHRDIKPQNIMIFHEPLHCKLIDFGLSKNINEAHTSIAGTQKYASPKLKRKLKFQRAGIKSNPVKDDVFSFGVTLLELVTKNENNTYNHRTFQQVVGICKKQRIAILLEYMLQEQEQKRPTFKELLCIIEQKQMITKEMKIQSIRFHIEKQEPLVQTERIFLQSKKKARQIQFSLPQQTQKLIKQDYDFDSPRMEQTVKKLLHQGETPIKTFQACINNGLRCLQNFKDMIICGTDNGQMRFIRNKEVIYTHKIHNNFITNFIQGEDKKYFYSYGGDNKLVKFNKQNLYNNFSTKVHLQERKRQNIFKKVAEMINIYDLKENEDYTIVELPDKQGVGVSCASIKDDQNFIVGYVDGTIYYEWKGIKRLLNKIADSAPITSLQVYQDILFLSDGDGYIKSIQLMNIKFLNNLYCAKKLIVSMKVLPDEQLSTKAPQQKSQQFMFNIAYLTIDGKVQFLNQEGTLQSSQNLKMINVMECKHFKGKIYTLLACGQVYQERKQLIKLQIANKNQSSITWNCMTELTDNSLAFGSFQGNLLIYKL